MSPETKQSTDDKDKGQDSGSDYGGDWSEDEWNDAQVREDNSLGGGGGGQKLVTERARVGDGWMD